MAQALSVVEEQKVVALLIREETYDTIKSVMKQEFDRSMKSDTILAVKKRNIEQIEKLKQRNLVIAATKEQENKNDANDLISKQLKAAQQAHEILIQAQQDYISGIIELKEYDRIIHSVHIPTLQELTTVSREMHNQVKDIDTPPDDKIDNTALLAAIQANDTVTINQLIFKKGNSA